MTGFNENVSILDKTDWRKPIQLHLTEAVRSIGREDEFFYNVERALQTVKAEYPNWNATVEVDNMVKRIEDKYDFIITDWIQNHEWQWGFPWVRASKWIDWKTKMYREILQELMNIVGKHRMLLWGIKSVKRGTQMGLNGDSTDEILIQDEDDVEVD